MAVWQQRQRVNLLLSLETTCLGSGLDWCNLYLTDVLELTTLDVTPAWCHKGCWYLLYIRLLILLPWNVAMLWVAARRQTDYFINPLWRSAREVTAAGGGGVGRGFVFFVVCFFVCALYNTWLINGPRHKSSAYFEGVTMHQGQEVHWVLNVHTSHHKKLLVEPPTKGGESCSKHWQCDLCCCINHMWFFRFLPLVLSAEFWLHKDTSNDKASRNTRSWSLQVFVFLVCAVTCSFPTRQSSTNWCS